MAALAVDEAEKQRKKKKRIAAGERARVACERLAERHPEHRPGELCQLRTRLARHLEEAPPACP